MTNLSEAGTGYQADVACTKNDNVQYTKPVSRYCQKALYIIAMTVLQET